jgi:flagella basal body P-ring formation protein FlgA
MRRLSFALFFALIWTGAAQPASGNELRLRQSIVVDGASIRLGDIFDGADSAADTVVATAPSPGRKIMFRPSYLAAVARKTGHIWRVPPGLNRVVAVRGSNIVPMQDIRDQLVLALQDLVGSENMDVQFAARRIELHVDRSQVPSVSIEDVSYDRLSQRFRASLLAPAGDPSAPRVWVSGRVHMVKEVPVLSRRVSIGAPISEDDLKFVRIRTDRVGRSIVSDASALIGMAPRRPIQAGQPIRASDLKQPETVQKGGLVTMTLKSGRLTLTAIGRALRPGAMGDIIPVVNVQSHKTVHGTITAPGRIEILLPRQLAVN